MKIKMISIGIFSLLLLSAMHISAVHTHINSFQGIDNTILSANNPETIYILIIDSLYDDLEGHLNVYIQDLDNEGFTAQLIQIPDSYGYDNHIEIRSILQEGYVNNSLVGCIFIGDIPHLKIDGFVSDFYYMDLDGNWIDEDDDGRYDIHTGDRDLEIWVGRLWTPKGGNDIELLKNYFRKNHAYRTGNLNLPKRALYYETRWDQWHDPGIEQLYVRELHKLYDDVTFVAPWEGDPSPSDYLNRLQEGYEFIYLHSWSTITSHTFTNGDIHYYDIDDTDPQAFFYFLSACNVANYENRNYMVGSYIFSESYGLTALAPTTSSYEHPVWIYPDFVEALNNDNCIGESFKIAYNDMIQDYRDICCLYSHTIVGDPSFSITTTYDSPLENHPPAKPIIEGSTNGNVDQLYSYNITFVDEDLDRIVSFSIDWGDGTVDNTDTLLQSRSTIMVSHTWVEQGTYVIKVKATDEKDDEGDWGILEVSMPKTYSLKTMFFDIIISWLEYLFERMTV
jgi:hypothetical protein